MSNQPQDFLADGAQTYEQKNDDYGNSWELTGEIMWLILGEQPVTLETPEDFIRFGLWTRRLDKFCRAMHGEFVADEKNYESVQDNHLDDMVYAAMHATTHEVDEPDVDEIEQAFERAMAEARDDSIETIIDFLAAGYDE